MFTLAFDTSTAHGLVCIINEASGIIASSTWTRQGSHGERLTPSIEDCLLQANMSIKELNAIAVGIGPGSFTGVRVAVNAARTLAFSLNKDVYTYDTLELLAAGAGRTDLPLLTMVNAHKNLIFAATFHHANGEWQRSTGTQVYEPEKLDSLINEPHLCIGDGFLEYEENFAASIARLLVRDEGVSDYPQPESFNHLLSLRKRIPAPVRLPISWRNVQALYIRESGAEEMLREKRQNE